MQYRGAAHLRSTHTTHLGSGWEQHLFHLFPGPLFDSISVHLSVCLSVMKTCSVPQSKAQSKGQVSSAAEQDDSFYP